MTQSSPLGPICAQLWGCGRLEGFCFPEHANWKGRAGEGEVQGHCMWPGWVLLGSFSERLKGVRVRGIDGLAGARPGFCFRREVYSHGEASGRYNSGQNLDGRSCSPGISGLCGENVHWSCLSCKHEVVRCLQRWRREDLWSPCSQGK